MIDATVTVGVAVICAVIVTRSASRIPAMTAISSVGTTICVVRFRTRPVVTLFKSVAIFIFRS